MIERHYPLSRSHIVYDPALLPGDPQFLFEPEHTVPAAGATAPSASVEFVEVRNRDFAWKRYRRRGLIAKFLQDQYGWRQLPKTRMWREFHMLHEVHQLGLPVPRPVAARCVYRSRLAYSGDLLSERISDAVNLREVLRKQALDPLLWAQIGQMIADFHRLDVYHDDLNASNILIQRADRVYLVDFDKCRFRHGLSYWKMMNLARLQHSLRKLSRKFAGFHFTQLNWSLLLEGYNSGVSLLPSKSS